MTPAPTGIEALLAHVEMLRAEALRGAPFAQHDYSLAVVAAFPQILTHLRSQSRALAEREETIGRLREALRPFAVAHEKESKRVQPYPAAWVTESDWDEAAEALASAPKGEGEGTT